MARKLEPGTRREVLVAGAGLLIAGCATSSTPAPERKAPAPERGEREGAEEKEPEVSPAEDLMREHGVLRRILLVYDEAAARLIAGRVDAVPQEPLMRAAQIVRAFVEDYHEKLEEEFVFPALERAGQQVELVQTLKQQHDAGRRVTDQVMASIPSVFAQAADGGVSGITPVRPEREKLASALQSFTRMYRPHAAREDTVLFPAFKKVVSPSAYDQLGETFEDRERQLFGPEGFEKNVAQVAEIERAFGIYELSKFTP